MFIYRTREVAIRNFRGNLCKFYQNLNELWQIACNFRQNVEMAFWAIGNFNYEFDYRVFVRQNLGEICNFWNRVKLSKTRFWNFNETYCCSHTVKFLIATLQFLWLIGIFFTRQVTRLWAIIPVDWWCACFCRSFAGRWPEKWVVIPNLVSKEQPLPTMIWIRI